MLSRQTLETAMSFFAKPQSWFPLRSCGVAFLIFLSSPVAAEWVVLSRSSSGGEFAVERETIMNLGKQLQVRVLVNYPVEQRTGELSSISDSIVSCSRLMVKDTRIRTYSAEYGRGRKLSDDDLVTYELDFWRAPQKGSAEHLFLQSLCEALSSS